MLVEQDHKKRKDSRKCLLLTNCANRKQPLVKTCLVEEKNILNNMYNRRAFLGLSPLKFSCVASLTFTEWLNFLKRKRKLMVW